MSDDPTITKVHEDARGSMYSISLPDNRELMLLFSKKGTLRGGHSHSVREQVMVLTGKMVYHKLGLGGRPTKKPPSETTEYRTVLEAGDCSPNAAGRIHYGEFLEPTWLIECKLAKKGEWTQENYPPWRALVEANARDFREKVDANAGR